MANLEARYRRLMRWYPAEHRAVYQEEMLGVLMDSAGPGRTRPSLAETVDLLAGALAYRVRRLGRDLRGESWRSAAAVVAVLAPAVLLVRAVRALLGLAVIGRYIYLDGTPPIGPSVWVPPLTWALVLGAAFAGRRRLAAVLCCGGVLVEAGRQMLLYHRFGVLADPPLWMVMLAVAGALGLTFGDDPRAVRRLLGGRRVVALAVFGVFLAAAPWLRYGIDVWIPALSVWLETYSWTSVAAVTGSVALVLGVPRPVRQRLLVVLGPLLIVAVPETVLWGDFNPLPLVRSDQLIVMIFGLLTVLALAVFVLGVGLAARARPGPPSRRQSPYVSHVPAGRCWPGPGRR
jgi:hypothetical protein